MGQGYSIPEDELRGQAEADGITHLSTGAAIVHESKVLAVRRATDDFLGGSFELPGGGVDRGETFEEAVKREVTEETGLEVTAILGMFPGFEYTTPEKPHVRQFNFLASVKGTDVKLSHEHDQFVWVESDDEIDSLMASEQMKVYLKDALAVAVDLD